MPLDLADYHKHMKGENVFFAQFCLLSNPVSVTFIAGACDVREAQQEQGRVCPTPS